MSVYKEKFNIGNLEIHEIHMENRNGIRVSFLTLGGIITEISIPDRDGKPENIVAAYEDYEEYLSNPAYFGAIIGRTAGRIKDAVFTINGKEYALAKNYGPNSGQGGTRGFDKRIFNHEVREMADESSVVLSLISSDHEEGYPGEAAVDVTYTLADDDTFTITYQAVSSEDTLVNLTNHSYFNLSGSFEESIKYHELFIDADYFTELDETSAPTGRLLKVEGSPFDFRHMREIGEEMDTPDEQLSIGNGYDHAFLFNQNGVTKVRLAHRFSGRVMEVETDNQAVVVYTQNYAKGQLLKDGNSLQPRRSIALEVQRLPIGAGEAFKEHSYLSAHERYSTVTKFRFFVESESMI